MVRANWMIVLFEIKLICHAEMEMKPLRIFMYLSLTLLLTACSGWTVNPLPYITPTPLPSQTPSIYTATPIILPPPVISTFTSLPLTSTLNSTSTTSTLEPTLTDTASNPTITPVIETVSSVNIKVDILGCNTSIDLTHGLGEVTNGYVTISNLGTNDLENVCATLRGKDEGKPHPDKTKCLTSLPAGYHVTQKLTIDTTFKEASPIQIDVTSNDVLLERVGKDACKVIGLFPPDYDSLGTIKKNP